MPYGTTRQLRRRGTSRRRSGRPARKRVWARSSTTFDMGAGTITFFEPLASFETDYGADILGSTVARIRLTGRVTRTAGVGFGELVMGVKTSDRVSDPVVADGPSENTHADWMWWKTYFPNLDGSESEIYIEDDVRAMRKLEELGQTLRVILQSPRTDQAFTGQLALSTLLLLP